MKQIFTCLVFALLLPCPAFSQQSATGQRQGLFGSAPAPLFGDGSRPSWWGGSRDSQSGTGSGTPFGSWFQRPQSNPAGNGVQLPSDPNQQAEWFNSLAGQVQTLNGRLSQFDTDNQQLHTELAAYRQKIQAAGDYNYQLKQQLTDTIAQLQQLQGEKRNLEQQLAAARLANGPQGQPASGPNGVPSQLPGAAMLRANNSLLQQLPQLRIPGVGARMDGDVIRIEIPSDALFVPGTFQISSNHGAMLQEIAAAINRNFSRQIVGVEAHWDGTAIQPATTTHHQLTATQALAVFDAFKSIGLPERQFFTMAMGSNRPRHAPGGPSNRRVEIVIYPETWDAR